MEYTPHNWTTGETVTSNKLNHIEEGIADAAREINELEDLNPFAGEVDVTDAERNTALANVSNQTANSITGKMGYVVLQPEKQGDATTTFAAQIANKPNTIFEIRDVFDLSNRFAGIGVNNASILYNVEMPEDARDPDSPMVKKHILLLHHRSGQVAEGIGSIHVVPAGSYQPVGVDIRSDFNVQMANTVYREFGEELLNIDEFFHLGDEEVLEEQYRRWKVILLGMGFEPLNTKVEMLTAMKVDLEDPENRKFFGGNDTMEGLTQFFSDNYEGKLTLVPLEKKTLHQYQSDPRTTQSGKEILTIMLEHLNFFLQP